MLSEMPDIIPGEISSSGSLPSAKHPVTQPVTRGVAAAKFLSNCIFGVLVTRCFIRYWCLFSYIEEISN